MLAISAKYNRLLDKGRGDESLVPDCATPTTPVQNRGLGIKIHNRPGFAPEWLNCACAPCCVHMFGVGGMVLS